MADESKDVKGEETEAEKPAAQTGTGAEEKPGDETQKSEEEQEKAEEEAVRKKPWFQRRIDEITRQRHEAERRAMLIAEQNARLIALLDKLQGTPGAMPASGQATPGAEPKPPVFTRPMPTREQFDYDEQKYLDAVVDWKLEQRQAAEEIRRREVEQKQGFQEWQTNFQRRVQEMSQVGEQKYPDYHAVVSSVPADVFNLEMSALISECTNAADVAYHLAKNQAEAARIAKLSPAKKAIELGKIEAAIMAAQKKTTQAPAPPNPVGGKGAPVIDPDKLPINEWVKKRERGEI